MSRSTDCLRLPSVSRTITGSPKGIERAVVGPELSDYTGIRIIGTGLRRVTVIPIPLLDYLNVLLKISMAGVCVPEAV
jgi:hypothetical protein